MARSSALCAAVLALAGTSFGGAVPAAPGLDTGALLRVPTPTATSPGEVGVVEARQAKPTIAYVEGFKALGCFQDGGILTITSTADSDLTPHLCRNWCSVRSAPVFGLKLGFRCFCGEEIEPHAQKASEEECTRACFGASSQLCGAADRLNLYAPTDMDVGTLGDNAPTVLPTGGASQPTPTSGSGDDDDEDANGNGDGPDASETTRNPGSPTGGGQDIGLDENDPESSNPEDQTSSAPGGANLSVGAVIGIAVGAAAISGILSAVVVCFLCRRRRRRSHDEAYSSRLPPAQPMVYANTAPSPAQAPIPPPSPMSQHGGPHEMREAYKPHDGSVTQSYSLSPNSVSPPPPVSAVSQQPPPPPVSQPQYAPQVPQPQYGAQELHPQSQQPQVPQPQHGSHELHSHASGPFEMHGNAR